MQKKIIFVDFQFVIGNGKQYFIKELALVKQGCLLPEHYLFKPPYPQQELTVSNIQQNDYNRKYINGLEWESGIIEYNFLPHVLKNLESYIIYVKGKQKKDFLSKYISEPVNIIDISSDIPKLEELQDYDTYCGVHSMCNQSTRNRCAIKNCFKIYMCLLKYNKINF